MLPFPFTKIYTSFYKYTLLLYEKSYETCKHKSQSTSPFLKETEVGNTPCTSSTGKDHVDERPQHQYMDQ